MAGGRIAIWIGSLPTAAALLFCAAAPAATVTSNTATAGAPADSPASASANCPAKQHVVAAGFATTTTPTQGVLATSLVPTATGVTAGALNVSGTAGSVSGTAYCTPNAPTKKGKKKKKKKAKHAAAAKKKKKKKHKKPSNPQVLSGTWPIPGGAATGTATVTCPQGKTVRGAGFSTVPVTGGTYVLSSLELVSPSQVRAVVEGYSLPTNATTVTATALCGTGPALGTVIGPAASIPAGASGTSTASCPAGKTVAFGGLTEGGTTVVAYPDGLARASSSSVTASAFSNAAGQTVTAIAYCG